MKKLTTVLFSLFFVAQLLANSTAINQFIAANEAYEKGEFDDAINIYEDILSSGHLSADLHYNLGNAYYKKDMIAKAILHYEKALKLKPNFKDATYNLELANSKTIDKIESIPELFLYRWWKSIYNLFSISGWTRMFFISLILATIGFSVYFLSREKYLQKVAFYIASTILVLSILCWIMAAAQNKNLHTVDYAIIISPTVNINSSPSAGSSKLFVLHKGTKVKIEDTKKEWVSISLSNGNKGWIKSDLLEGI